MIRIRALVALSLLLASLGVGEAVARTLSDSELYYRCFAQMVRSRPLANDPRLLAIKAGTKTPVDACMELFDLAKMQNGLLAANQIPSIDDSNIPIGARIVKTFHGFHRTAWLQSDNIAAHANRAKNTEWVIDSTNSAYFLTRALFEPGIEYKSVVTATENLGSVRNTPVGLTWNLRRDFYNSNGYIGPVDLTKFFVRYSEGDSNTDLLFAPELLEFGSLIGIKPKDPQPLPAPLDGGASKSDNIHALLGGGAGAISTPAYFILNNGHDFQTTDGGAIVPRRWSKAVLRDLMCRELPVLRLSDVEKTVQPDSTLSFRQNVGCMQCHQTIDNMAFATRNYVHTESGGFTTAVANYHLQYVKEYSTDLGEFLSPTDGSATFSRTTPTGKFVFRSYDGTLANDDVIGFSGIGSALASSKDLYACAAKRYFEFFTHIDTTLDDIGDPDTAIRLNKRDYEYRNFVIQLGAQLNTNQSLRELIRGILSSEYYRKSDYGALE